MDRLEAGKRAWRRWAERNPGTDREQRRAKQARYRQRYPERAREQVRRARAKHRERYNEQRRLKRRGIPSERQRPKSDVLAGVSPVSAHYMPARSSNGPSG